MLWITWFKVVWELKPAFSHIRTFHWSIVLLISFCIRSDDAGITSFVRAHMIKERYYQCLLDVFHSNAIDLTKLTQLWVSACMKFFKNFILTANGKSVLLVDGLKIGKEGRKMPGVKLLHQSSQNNSKAEFIMGHSFQCVSLLVHSTSSFLSIPLCSRIHEGVKTSKNDSRTLMTKLATMLRHLKFPGKYYLVADAYYFCGSLAKDIVKQGNHLITKIKINAVAYLPYSGIQGKGRKKIYGDKVKLKNLFKGGNGWGEALSPVYGEVDVILKYKVVDLLWKNFQGVARYVLVKHPTRGKMILLATDPNLDPVKIIELYGLRFKIEVSFKFAVHKVGTYFYHFWMKNMNKLRRGDGDQLLTEMPANYRKQFQLKIRAYNIHVQFGLIAQGLLQYLSLCHSREVWQSFGSWLRTIRPDVPPSEHVVSMALKNSYMVFLLSKKIDLSFAKFIIKRMCFRKVNSYQMTG